ncbi:MAG: BrnA antitoxin family protein [Muribaculum sp.]|nr:BrnA antitoxin family protein [Muribaculum sp.]
MGGIGSGGARKGAGRKPADGAPRDRISVTLPSQLLSHIRTTASRRNIPASQLITELIQKGLK